MPRTNRTVACWLSVMFLVGLPCVMSPQVTNTGPRLVFSAKPTKSSFPQGEQIFFNFRLRNDDSTDVLVSSALILGYDITLDVKNSSGKAIPWCGVVTQWVRSGKELVVLRPGKDLAINRQISCDRQKQEGYSLLGLGKYLVIARYSVPIDSGRAARDLKNITVANGPYLAEPLEFTIIAPKGETGR